MRQAGRSGRPNHHARTAEDHSKREDVTVAEHWRGVKNEIEEEIDRIRWQEPEEVKMRGRNTPKWRGNRRCRCGQPFVLVADTQAMGPWTTSLDPTAIANPVFTLEHWKRMWTVPLCTWPSSWAIPTLPMPCSTAEFAQLVEL